MNKWKIFSICFILFGANLCFAKNSDLNFPSFDMFKNAFKGSYSKVKDKANKIFRSKHSSKEVFIEQHYKV